MEIILEGGEYSWLRRLRTDQLHLLHTATRQMNHSSVLIRNTLRTFSDFMGGGEENSPASSKTSVTLSSSFYLYITPVKTLKRTSLCFINFPLRTALDIHWTFPTNGQDVSKMYEIARNSPKNLKVTIGNMINIYWSKFYG